MNTGRFWTYFDPIRFLLVLLCKNRTEASYSRLLVYSITWTSATIARDLKDDLPWRTWLRRKDYFDRIILRGHAHEHVNIFAQNKLGLACNAYPRYYDGNVPKSLLKPPQENNPH
jgi:hypothetical protein